MSSRLCPLYYTFSRVFASFLYQAPNPREAPPHNTLQKIGQPKHRDFMLRDKHRAEFTKGACLCLVSNSDKIAETRHLGKLQSSPATPSKGWPGAGTTSGSLSPHSCCMQQVPHSERTGPLFPTHLQSPHQQILKPNRNILIIG